ncbi:CDGSH iron-sulfur domain-containing protein [Arthrobacter gandavensis]|uniref:CDGSH iron-sulfur domain-containing protein n=1 Tax=Arthrobacter gandavensis TaxID=169960 RepID=UPI00189059F0|nr:CDGSH iron-sulfur domain-containing protein [Arthrobacter gandavensis]MBF4994694.1 CDGSH iron-sulfur domain-containing protein [Arthrobacter gandavensis]
MSRQPAPGGDAVSVPGSEVTIVPSAGARAGEPFAVTECPGGPLLVRGDFEIMDSSGNEVPKNRETVALCRCAGSRIKPWCDGTHKLLRRASEN